MNERIISLKFNKKDFEEIYFTDKKRSLFFSPKTKALTITFLFLSIITIVFYFGGFWGISNWGILYLLLFFAIVNLLRLASGVLTVLNWRNSIEKYLKEMESYSKLEVIVLKDYINVVFDDKENFTHWSEFKRVIVNDKYISLEGKVNYLFPKKSMCEEDYTFFKKSIKNILAQ